MSDAINMLEGETTLTSTARNILSAGGDHAYSALVVRGGGNVEAKRLLQQASPAQLVAKPIVNANAGSAALAGLWLWHDWLDESHTISQSIHTSTGSFWHAIMHRREGDFGNSKYWYARCRGHPAHARVADLARPLLEQPANAALAQRFSRSDWDGYALVDFAEEAERRPKDDPARVLAVDLQGLEWVALFKETLHQAVGGSRR